MRRLCPILLLLLACLTHRALADTPTPTLTVGAEPDAEVSPLLFGQFLEIASWGELGPEAFADPETGELPEPIVQKLAELHAPLIRFPFGSDAPFLRWTDRIHISGRPTPVSAERGDGTLTNHFTYDHFLRLCERLEARPLLVVRATPALTGEMPLMDIAKEAGNLVAYCNMPVALDVPADQLAFAELRAANGREAPYHVKRWQVGNELFHIIKEPDDPEHRWAGLDEVGIRESAEPIIDGLSAIADAMIAVDPTIELAVDAEWFNPLASLIILSDPRIRSRFDVITNHRYGPWKTKTLHIDGREQPSSAMTPAQLLFFGAWFPCGLGVDGLSEALHPWVLTVAERFGYRVASTEWNWNGWGGFDQSHPHVAAHARALGTAGFLNGLIRQSHGVDYATQSLMLASNWNIGSVKAEPDDPASAFLSPTGAVTALYSEHHGPQRHAVTLSDLPPPLNADLRHGDDVIGPTMPVLDAVATASSEALYVHAVHRHPQEPLTLRIELPDDRTVGRATLHHLQIDAEAEPALAATRRGRTALDVADPLTVTLPPASVCVIEIRTPPAPQAP